MTSGSDDVNQSSTTSENVAPSSERPNQKGTPPSNFVMPTRSSTRNRQPTLTNALANPIPINTIIETNREAKAILQFEIDLPPDKPEAGTKSSLNSLIQEMGFTDKTPEYQVCVKFLEAISPKNKNKTTKLFT